MGWFDFTTITPLAEYTVDQTLASSTKRALVNASGGGITITLGAAADNTRTEHTIKKIDSSGNRVRVKPNGDEKIDGEDYIDILYQGSYITIICDGTEWWIIGGMNVKLEELIENKLNEVIDGLEELLLEAKQQTLHQASLSEENISVDDLED